MLDPLGQSQVLPYLRALASRGVKFTLLSFERAHAFTEDGRETCRRLYAELGGSGIEWHWLRYHQTPSLPATSYDVWRGLAIASKLVKRNQIELVHARSHIPATIALGLKRRFGTRMIFDVRGLLADEYVDAGHWQQGSLPYRLTKTMERRALAATDGIVTLTEAIWPLIKDWPGLHGREIPRAVVPCCTDLDLFVFQPDSRTALRQELGVEDRFVIVYSGSIDGWYLTERMADFFAYLAEHSSQFHFLWLTPGHHHRIQDLMAAKKVSGDRFTVRAAKPHEVPAYLSASDAGVAFIKRCFSKLASSPTKYAEYLACGLPLVVNAGIGDSDALITEESAGVLLSDFSEAEFKRAADLLEVYARDASDKRGRLRETAERLFDVNTVGVERYARLYQRVLS